MIFQELNKEEFKYFLDKQPLKTFFQDPKMEEIGKMVNWNTTYVGIKENNKIIAGTRLMYKKVHFSKKIFYAPRGILVDYNNTKLLDYFINELKKYIKRNNGYTLHIDPTLMYKERDINGDIVENGINNENVVKHLLKLGFKHDGFTREYDYTKQNRWIFELPINGKDKETILKEMNGNTRRAIKKAEHLGVKVRELKRNELEIFKDIMNETSERRDFQDRNFEYYLKMYDLFKNDNQIKYMVAEVNIDETINILNTDLEKLNKLLDNSKKHNKIEQIKEYESQIKDLNNKIDEINDIIKNKGNHLYLSSAMFMIYGDEIVYYHSGGYKEYMNFFGQYLIQWEMIKEAINLGKTKYNFLGIKGNFDKNDQDYGVYLFKRGFNGNVIEYIGDFYLPTSIYYYIMKL